MKAVNPYLNFAGNTEEAFAFYKSVFGGEFQAVIRFKDFGDNPMDVPDSELDKIAHISLPLTPDTVLMGTDVPKSMPAVTVGNNFYITLEPESQAEAERLFDELSAGGRTEMPLQKTDWAEKYGSCADRFGIQWMINYTGNVQFPGSSAA